MERTPSKKCGYMTGKGKKCKNPSESCRFHYKSVGKKVSPKKSTSPKSFPKKEIDIDFLNDLPVPVLYQTLLKVPRKQLNEICKSASKTRIRGVVTKIEKICRSDRFQKEYIKIYGYLEYPEIFEDKILFLGRYGENHLAANDSHLSIIVNEEGDPWEMLASDLWRDEGSVTFIYDDEYYMTLTMLKNGIWKVKLAGNFLEKPALREYFIKKTGRPQLFSKDYKIVAKQAIFFLKQISDEIVRKYKNGNIVEVDASLVRKFFGKFGV
jgi:hypothetical protein